MANTVVCQPGSPDVVALRALLTTTRLDAGRRATGEQITRGRSVRSEPILPALAADRPRRPRVANSVVRSCCSSDHAATGSGARQRRKRWPREGQALKRRCIQEGQGDHNRHGPATHASASPSGTRLVTVAVLSRRRGQAGSPSREPSRWRAGRRGRRSCSASTGCRPRQCWDRPRRQDPKRRPGSQPC